MKLYFHPLSTYSQKALIAFYEKGVEFTPEIVNVMTPEGAAEYRKIYPLGKLPFLKRSDGWAIPESTIIIEYLDTNFDSGTRLIPADKELARRARFFDRQFDFYVNNPLQVIFFDGLKPEAERNPKAVAQAKATLDTMYPYLDGHFAKNTWAIGDDFSLADCAAAPPLAYLRRSHPFHAFKNLTAYADRLTARPSFARALREAEPHLAAFAAGAR